MPFSRRFAFGAFALVIVAATIAGLYVIRARPVHARPGPPASLEKLVATSPSRIVPAIAFTDATGKQLMLGTFKGRFVLVNLWASWCAPCVRELPALAHLQQAIPGTQLDVVAINVGRATEDESKSFLTAHGAATLGIYMDTGHALLRAFNTYVLPLTVLIGPDGREEARAIGPAQWDAPDAIAYLKALTTPGKHDVPAKEPRA